jgi:hypothetical protein
MIRSNVRIIRYYDEERNLNKINVTVHGKINYLSQLTDAVLSNKVKSFNVRISDDIYTCHMNNQDKKDLISTGNLLQVLYNKCHLAREKYCLHCSILDKSDILANKSYRLILN